MVRCGFFGAGVVGVATSLRLRLDHSVLHGISFPTSPFDCRSLSDRCCHDIITGFAVGLECTAAPVLAISTAILSAYYMGERALPGGGLYGTAVATMGMLSTAAYILAMDTFGPITDNAGGIIEMSGQPEAIRKRDGSSGLGR